MKTMHDKCSHTYVHRTCTQRHAYSFYAYMCIVSVYVYTHTHIYIYIYIFYIHALHIGKYTVYVQSWLEKPIENTHGFVATKLGGNFASRVSVFCASRWRPSMTSTIGSTVRFLALLQFNKPLALAISLGNWKPSICRFFSTFEAGTITLPAAQGTSEKVPTRQGFQLLLSSCYFQSQKIMATNSLLTCRPAETRLRRLVETSATMSQKNQHKQNIHWRRWTSLQDNFEIDTVWTACAFYFSLSATEVARMTSAPCQSLECVIADFPAVHSISQGLVLGKRDLLVGHQK